MDKLTKIFFRIVLGALIVWALIVMIFSDRVNFGTNDNAGADVDVSQVEDGTYEGTAAGHNGDVTVEVVVAGGEITEINVLEHEETDGISDPAFEEVIPAIIDANSTDVDIVSGATVTSEAIIAAVNNALAGEGGDAPVEGEGAKVYNVEVEGRNGPIVVDVTIDGDTITAVDIVEHEETEDISDPAIEQIPAAIVEANSTDIEVVSGASITSGAIIEAVNQALVEAGLREETAEPEVVVDGNLYTVTVEGHNGPLTVEVTIEEGTITAVEVTEHAETEGLADPAIEDVPAAIIEANSTDVEVVSGASVTSEAIIEAVNLALEAAGGETQAPAEGEVYQVEVEGHNDPIIVDVTIDGDTITAIEIVEHAETEGLADPALEDIPAAIIAANSTDVEVVSGATVTSEAVIEAVNQALGQAS